VAGAALFGVGWGLAGLCPGPALTSLASGEPGAFLFVTTMAAGIVTSRFRRANTTPVITVTDRSGPRMDAS
jgi:uncharacterized membrane protein YedE/YeeE